MYLPESYTCLSVKILSIKVPSLVDDWTALGKELCSPFSCNKFISAVFFEDSSLKLILKSPAITILLADCSMMCLIACNNNVVGTPGDA